VASQWLSRMFRPQWPTVAFDEMKKRARLLVIDDNDFPYQSLFDRDGYTLDKWNDVDDLSKIESGYFDIILLDLQGVGIAQSAEQGLGVLKHIRRKNPCQILIAYSNAGNN
jgi:CheY-like chemotaxis protein